MSRIALAGNPNSGKTTLFNHLTGSRQHVGNWPGVTVDKKEGTYKAKKGQTTHKIMDLPGTYSLSPYSDEERIAREYIVKERPDVVIDIVDATNLERNLYLTLQIMETGVPTVIALNMMDEVEARKDSIDAVGLSQALGIPCVPITARTGKGIDLLMTTVEALAEKKETPVLPNLYGKELESAREEIAATLTGTDAMKRWEALQILDGDEELGTKNPQAEAVLKKLEASLGDDISSYVADCKYRFIGTLASKYLTKAPKKTAHTKSDKIDKILTNRILALPIFGVIMFCIFKLTFGESLFFGTVPGPGTWLQGLVGDFWDNMLTPFLLGLLEHAHASEWAVSLVGDGILAGLGSILSFLPQIVILFLLLSFLEDWGYMARVAFVMDKLFRRFGLSGKSFIPLLMGFGCSIPANMSTRTLDSTKDRRLTMMIVPFMSCGAKLPIYLMFAATLFADGDRTLLVFSIYLLGIVVAILSGIILNKTVFKGETSPFIMELPPYRIPTARSILIHAWEKIRGFVVKAGTIIFASTVLIWFLSYFTFEGGFHYIPQEEMEKSIAAYIGRAIQWIFVPLGFGNSWQPVVGTFTGFIAKENVVSTFGVLFHTADDIVEGAASGANALPGVADVFTQLTAYSYMAFNLLCMPCFAAVGSMKKEMGSWKWTLKAIGFQMLTAYIVALLIFQIGRLFF